MYLCHIMYVVYSVTNLEIIKCKKEPCIIVLNNFHRIQIWAENYYYYSIICNFSPSFEWESRCRAFVYAMNGDSLHSFICGIWSRLKIEPFWIIIMNIWVIIMWLTSMITLHACNQIGSISAAKADNNLKKNNTGFVLGASKGLNQVFLCAQACSGVQFTLGANNMDLPKVLHLEYGPSWRSIYLFWCQKHKKLTTFYQRNLL